MLASLLRKGPKEAATSAVACLRELCTMPAAIQLMIKCKGVEVSLLPTSFSKPGLVPDLLDPLKGKIRLQSFTGHALPWALGAARGQGGTGAAKAGCRLCPCGIAAPFPMAGQLCSSQRMKAVNTCRMGEGPGPSCSSLGKRGKRRE